MKEYYVVRRGREWRVVGIEIDLGPYPSFEIAKQAAIALAKVDFTERTRAKVFAEENLLSGMKLIYDSSDGG